MITNKQEILDSCIDDTKTKALAIKLIRLIAKEKDNVKRWIVLETILMPVMRAEIEVLSRLDKGEIKRGEALFSGFYLFRSMLMYNLSKIMSDSAKNP